MEITDYNRIFDDIEDEEDLLSCWTTPCSARFTIVRKPANNRAPIGICLAPSGSGLEAVGEPIWPERIRSKPDVTFAKTKPVSSRWSSSTRTPTSRAPPSIRPILRSSQRASVSTASCRPSKCVRMGTGGS